MSNVKYYWGAFPLPRMEQESLGGAQSSGTWERPLVFKHTVVPWLSEPAQPVGEALLLGACHSPCPGTHPISHQMLPRPCWTDGSPGGHTGTPCLGCQEPCLGYTLCGWLWGHMGTAPAVGTIPPFSSWWSLSQNSSLGLWFTFKTGSCSSLRHWMDIFYLDSPQTSRLF